jgi:hypothetical protein
MIRLFAYGQISDEWEFLGVLFFWLIVGILALVLAINLVLLGVRNKVKKKKLSIFSIIKISFFGVFIAAGLWVSYETIKFDKEMLDYLLGFFLGFLYLILMKLAIDRELTEF